MFLLLVFIYQYLFNSYLLYNSQRFSYIYKRSFYFLLNHAMSSNSDSIIKEKIKNYNTIIIEDDSAPKAEKGIDLPWYEDPENYGKIKLCCTISICTVLLIVIIIVMIMNLR